MKKIFFLCFILSSCSLVNKDLREQKKHARFVRHATEATRFLKDNGLLADTCFSIFPLKDSMVEQRVDSSDFVESVRALLAIIHEKDKAFDSVILLQGGKDSDCAYTLQMLASLYSEREKQFTTALPSVRPRVVTTTIRVKDSSETVALRLRYARDVQALTAALAKSNATTTTLRSEKITRTHQRNLLFWVMVTAVVVAFRKPIYNAVATLFNPAGSMGSFFSSLFKKNT